MSAPPKPRRSRALGSSATRATTPTAPSPAKTTNGPAGSHEAPKDASPAGQSDDVVVVHSRTEDGEGMNVVRKRGDELSIGVVRPLEEGKPILGDVVTLKPRAEHPALFDVKTEVALPQAEPKRSSGPSRVSSPSYRKGWESLWGTRRRRKTN